MSRNNLPDLQFKLANFLERECRDGERITITETSKSWVFLTPKHVYKLKKPIKNSFQNLTSLRARHSNCLTEIDLNRRLAPEVYQGIVRVTQSDDGVLGLDSPGRVVDWMIQMHRLPASRMLDQMIIEHAGDRAVLQPFIDLLAHNLAQFYKSCAVSNLRTAELFTILQDQQKMHRSVLLDPLFSELHPRFERVFSVYQERLGDIFEMMSNRVHDGWIRECHGDLRPEHICLTDPPVIFDCLEFNRNLRLLDPFREIVNLGLEAEMLDAPWIKSELLRIMASEFGAAPPAELLRFYEVTYALLRTQLCLAHLLVKHPRAAEKWRPLGLRYLMIAEHLLDVGTP